MFEQGPEIGLAVPLHRERGQRAGGADRDRHPGARDRTSPSSSAKPARSSRSAAARPRSPPVAPIALWSAAFRRCRRLLHALLDRFGALARPDGDGGEVARPFDRRRSGLRRRRGRRGPGARGRRTRARTRRDAARPGPRLRRRLRSQRSARRLGQRPPAPRRAASSACSRAPASSPRDIGRIVSGASGSIGGDRLEALTLRQAWEETSRCRRSSRRRRVTGEYGGGFLAAAVLACQRR